MNLFDIHHIFLTILGYPLSYAECLGTLFGFLSVWYATRQSMLTWPSGIINIVFFVAIFFQVQLYSDMFLQFYYFIMSVYGWVFWRKQQEASKPIVIFNASQRIFCFAWIIGGTILLGFFIKNLHIIFPALFKIPASFPFMDSAIAVMSITAMTLMARRVLENWILWIAVNVLCVYVYSMKHILFTAFEYGIFLLLAMWGYKQWLDSKKNNTNPTLGQIRSDL